MASNHRIFSLNYFGGLLALVLCLNGCATRSPVTDGMVLSLRKGESFIATNDPAYATTLQVRWLGTACYLLQLGDKIIFTDPFLTHHSLARVGLGGSIESNPEIVRKTVEGLPVPRAIFVGHSHYDHMLDLAECLKQPAWADVPVYGSVTTCNLLSGYGPQFTNGWNPVVTNAAWREVADGIRYQAVAARHGKQLPLLPLLFPGKIEAPLCKPPHRAGHFKVGDTYAFVFELSNDRAGYTIYFVGATHRNQEGFPQESVKSVDVAILCSPTWRLAKGYPDNIIQRLKARHVIASHYDNFFQVNQKETEVTPRADLPGFLLRAQKSANYPEFESILVPAVGSVLRFEGKTGGR